MNIEKINGYTLKDIEGRDLIESKQDTISDLDEIRSGATAGSTAVQPSALDPINTKLSEHDTAISSLETGKADKADLDEKQDKDSLDADVADLGFIKNTYHDDTKQDKLTSESSIPAKEIVFDEDHMIDAEALEAIEGAIREVAQTAEGKQDKIDDLDTIRSGASKGATSVQPADLDPINEHLDSHDQSIATAEVNIGNLETSKADKSELSTKQDVISDLEIIRSNAAEVVNKADMSALAATDAQVSTLTGTVGNHDTAITNMQGAISGIETALEDKADKSDLDAKQDKINTTETLIFTLKDETEITIEVYTK